MLKCFWIVFTMLTIMASVGCEKNPSEQYGDSLVQTYEHSKDVADAVNLDALGKAVQTYRAMNGKNPGSIEDIEKFMGMDIDREKYSYDPETGIIARKK
jgi:hypothetical protein